MRIRTGVPMVVTGGRDKCLGHETLLDDSILHIQDYINDVPSKESLDEIIDFIATRRMIDTSRGGGWKNG